MLKLNRAFAYGLGGIAISASFFAYFELGFIGFPDGFLSDWDRARKVILTLFVGISLLMAVWAIYLGWLATRQNIAAKVRVTGLLYTILALLVVIADQYFSQQSGLGG